MSDVKMRVLFCQECRTVEPLSMFEGNPADDQELRYLVDRHNRGVVDHHGQVAVVSQEDWEKREKRNEIIKKVFEQLTPGAETGLGSAAYNLMFTLKEDAFTCWGQHRRNPECPDYKSDAKRLVPDTREERKELGMSAKYDEKNPGLTRYLCEHCLTGDTEVVTREGIEVISELAGKNPELLLPVETRWGHHNSARGVFRSTEVYYFGEQRIFQVELAGGRARKVVRTSPEHRWFVREGEGTTTTVTKDLKPGDVLQPLKATGPRGRENIVSFGVSQGFVFGDGGVGWTDHRPAVLQIYNLDKDRAILPFFIGQDIRDVTVQDSYRGDGATRDIVKISGLPRHWKRLPPLDESRSFLLSWLAGYFAADGTVDKNGSASLSSAKLENLHFVRSLAAICGVGYGVVRKNNRQGFPGREKSMLYTLGLNARDLPDWFWIITEHKDRVEARLKTPLRERGWSVSRVVDTGVTESVYCAVVPEVGAFALSDDLMTGNCPVHSMVQQAERKKAGLYDA